MLNKESRGGWQRSLPLPDLSRKIEGPLLAGYVSRGGYTKVGYEEYGTMSSSAGGKKEKDNLSLTL